jgi:hypothetical protein
MWRRHVSAVAQQRALLASQANDRAGRLEKLKVLGEIRLDPDNLSYEKLNAIFGESPKRMSWGVSNEKHVGWFCVRSDLSGTESDDCLVEAVYLESTVVLLELIPPFRGSIVGFRLGDKLGTMKEFASTHGYKARWLDANGPDYNRLIVDLDTTWTLDCAARSYDSIARGEADIITLDNTTIGERKLDSGEIKGVRRF